MQNEIICTFFLQKISMIFLKRKFKWYCANCRLGVKISVWYPVLQYYHQVFWILVLSRSDASIQIICQKTYSKASFIYEQRPIGRCGPGHVGQHSSAHVVRSQAGIWTLISFKWSQSDLWISKVRGNVTKRRKNCGINPIGKEMTNGLIFESRF